MDNRPIGVFDSGVGGLTVVKQIIKTMPYEHTIYFGDTARVPYGSKSKETVTKFSSQIIRFLKTMDVKAVVIACNTVSSNCYEALTSEFPDLPIIEVVTPGVESCLAATKNNKVGLIGTEGTVSSGAYEKRLKAANNKDIDSIILGCTHYPLLKACIGKIVGEKVKIVDPAKATALKVKDYLTSHNMLNDLNTEKHTFYVSDNNAKFNTICERVLHKEFHAQQIDIEKY